MDFSSIIQDFDVKEKRYYELIENPSAQVLTEGNYMYTRVGLVLMETKVPIVFKNESIPKFLYQHPHIVTEEEIETEIPVEKRNKIRTLYMDKELNTGYGIIELTYMEMDINLNGPGMELKNSSLFIYHSNAKDHPKIWKQLPKSKRLTTAYFIYEIWIRKAIYDIQLKIDDILINRQVETKLKYFKENNYSKDSMMYKDIQRDIQRTADSIKGNWDVLTKKYGEIASEDEIAWILDDELYDKFYEDLEIIKFVQMKNKNYLTNSIKNTKKFKNKKPSYNIARPIYY